MENDIYTEQPKFNSQCKVCGVRGQCWKAFEKNNWFRGDDTYLGRICKNCIRANRFGELIQGGQNKNQSGDDILDHGAGMEAWENP